MVASSGRLSDSSGLCSEGGNRGSFRTRLNRVFSRPIALLPGNKGREASESGPRADIGKYWPWLIGVPEVLALAGGFGCGAYVGRLVDRHLAEAISAADRDDPDWRLEDLLANRATVRRSENSALVVEESSCRSTPNWPSDHSPDPGGPKPSTIPPSRHRSTHVTANNVNLDEEVAGILRDELHKYEDAVRIARRVADYDRGRHELELGPTLIDSTAGDAGGPHSGAGGWPLDAAIRAHDGDADVRLCARSSASAARSATSPS